MEFDKTSDYADERGLEPFVASRESHWAALRRALEIDPAQFLPIPPVPFVCPRVSHASG